MYALDEVQIITARSTIISCIGQDFLGRSNETLPSNYRNTYTALFSFLLFQDRKIANKVLKRMIHTYNHNNNNNEFIERYF